LEIITLASLRERLASELEKLVGEGLELLKALTKGDSESFDNPFRVGYQQWYTRALGAIRELVPDRLAEFIRLYQIEKRKQIDMDTYGIHDFMLGFSFTRGTQTVDVKTITALRFNQQVQIVESARSRLDDILSNVHGVVQAELLDSEIEAAKELLNANHLRAAGTVAGVVLERHLAKVCGARGFTTTKKIPTISDWNDKLKEQGIFDLPTWRGLQRLNDLRNICCHPKEREPVKEEVDELIRGAEKIVKTVN
jgi:hypothetical protein